ncbi:hypothetical protein [uncultured Fibrobacter sp.]|uniref:hypothetical protein n=1 Tax=uncultured Fibrobacter sp. TaxID=261512 RepID=UPI002803AEE1|nr:hypothetical protein [uncultured Fibrobacter sp.]
MKHFFQCSIFIFALLALWENSLSEDSLPFLAGNVESYTCFPDGTILYHYDFTYPSEEDIQDSNFKRHYSPPCEDILEYEGLNWCGIAIIHVLDNFFFEKKSYRLNGLAGRYKLQDSTLFLTGLDICFYWQKDGTNHVQKFRTKIPLELLFPGAKDSIVASFATGYMSYSCLDCQTDEDSSNFVNMEATFERGKITHRVLVSNFPKNPITKNYFPLCGGTSSENFWYLDNKKEFDLIYKEYSRHEKKWDHFYEYPLDTIQFKDLIDSLSPYYQKHRRNYLDSLAKEKEKQSSEKRKDSK